MLRAIADKAIADGVTPLEVLLDNMRFYQSKIKHAEQMLSDAIANKETPAALIVALQKLCNFRSEAGRFAVEAAPYVHPKLASVTVGGDPDNPLTMVKKIERAIAPVAPEWIDAEAGDSTGIRSVN